MTVLIGGLLLFGIAVLLHLLVWKIRIPKNQIKVLLFIFFVVYISGIFILWYAESTSLYFLPIAFTKLTEYLHITIFFITLVFTYCIIYGATVDISPSLFIVMNIADAGKRGSNQTDFRQLITDDLFIKPRMEYLVEQKMVNKKDDKYLLSKKGYNVLRIFFFIQKIMKLTQKSG